ncbi:MAG: FG-GAP repeat protein [Gilvibacter sp.]
MKLRITIVFVFSSLLSLAQVGIGTTNPEGALDITSSNMGLVIPRVPNFEVVTDGAGNPAVNGTMVYDILRQSNCYKIAGNWVCTGFDESGNLVTEEQIPINTTDCTYFKASNTGTNDGIGSFTVMSDDGNYLAVTTVEEDSNATGINGDGSNNSASRSGAVYVFVRIGGIWSQQAYIKASNAEANDFFGTHISLSNDGSRLAVGAYNERSNATGVGGDQTDNSINGAGAVYVFSRSGTTWAQEAYIKASNTGEDYDRFGTYVSLSDDGSRLAVGALGEDSNATGVGGDQTNNAATDSGAVYMFSRSGTTWSQEAYIKASNTEANDNFGLTLSLSGDATRLVVGTVLEDSNATGINGDETSNTSSSSGAAYVFLRSGTTWTQEAYIKASNTDANDYFGKSISLDADGNTLAIGANQEDSDATGIGGDQTNNTGYTSGAVYLFTRTGTTWSQQAYIKSGSSDNFDQFGNSLALSSDGDKLMVGAPTEDGYDSGLGGDPTNNDLQDAGAAFLFERSGSTWSQTEYFKACNPDVGDNFGQAVALNDSATLVGISAHREDSNATGVNGNMLSNSTSNSGAVYVFDN